MYNFSYPFFPNPRIPLDEECTVGFGKSAYGLANLLNGLAFADY
jgi:hypothetical protein